MKHVEVPALRRKLVPIWADASGALILLASAGGKLMSLGNQSALYDKVHPLFSVSYKTVAVGVTILEILAVASCMVSRKVFRALTLLLGANFLAYHILVKTIGIQEPCKCLGRLLTAFPRLADHESQVAVGLAGLLIAFSLVGSLSTRVWQEVETA